MEQDQLFQAYALELNNNCLVQVCIHHIVTDGWSMNLIRDDLLEFYQEALEGTLDVNSSVSPDNTTLQYIDFAAWQQKKFAGLNLDKEMDFWQKEIDLSYRESSLPFKNQGEEVKDITAGRVSTFVDEQTLNKAKACLLYTSPSPRDPE